MTFPLLPADLWNRVGDLNYYRDRNDDFIRRNPGRSPPDYYLGYGDKYAQRFTTDLRSKLSAAGQVWDSKALTLLQRAMEQRRTGDPAAFAALELDGTQFRSFAFGTHPAAYIGAGLATLDPQDVLLIVDTPDVKDLLTDDGIKQIVATALGVAEIDGVSGIARFTEEALGDLAHWDLEQIQAALRASSRDVEAVLAAEWRRTFGHGASGNASPRVTTATTPIATVVTGASTGEAPRTGESDDRS